MAVDPEQKPSVATQGPVLPPWLEQYQWPIIGVVIVIVVAVVGINWMKSGNKQANVDAFQRLTTAQTATDLMAVSSEYPDSAAAPLAMMKLAKTKFDEGSFEEALKTYEQFTSQYSQHTLAEGAELGKLHCLEAMGRTEDALKGFEQFQKGMHYLTPQAVIAQARCLRTLGRTEDARVVYEDYITANPKSIWTQRVRELLEEITEKPTEEAQTATPGAANTETVTAKSDAAETSATTMEDAETPAPVSKP